MPFKRLKYNLFPALTSTEWSVSHGRQDALQTSSQFLFLNGNMVRPNDNTPVKAESQEFQQNECQICQTSFPNYSVLCRHMSSIHGYKLPYTCSICQKGYLTYRGLKLHRQTHEATERKMFKCPICDSMQSQKCQIKRHLRTVHKSDQCPICKNVFDITEIDMHIQQCGLI